MSVATPKRKQQYHIEDRIMEAYAVAYHAYLARRDLPGPGPTFADFIEIRKLQYETEDAERITTSSVFAPTRTSTGARPCS